MVFQTWNLESREKKEKKESNSIVSLYYWCQLLDQLPLLYANIVFKDLIIIVKIVLSVTIIRYQKGEIFLNIFYLIIIITYLSDIFGINPFLINSKKFLVILFII